MADYEKDIKELIEKMNRQQTQMTAPQGFNQPTQVNEAMGTDQSPHLFNQGVLPNSPDQTPADPVNSVRPMGTPINQMPKVQNAANIQTTPPSNAGVSGNICSQCGTIHPPLPPGTKCPMAKVKVKDGKEEKEIDVNKFLVDLRNIILSQAEKKNIKDIEKLFKNIIVEVTKYLEGYSE
jgi:hypothetical protein